jgi:peptidoglycan/LPS O-acetylase OafA/YrhL
VRIARLSPLSNTKSPDRIRSIQPPRERTFHGLDGLRAGSVILVIGYHTWNSSFPGGFVGVDLFFVISGFLISALLLEEWYRWQSLSLFQFYVRRALRLFPALAVVLLVALIWSFGIAPPSLGAGTRVGILASLEYVTNWMTAIHPGWTGGAVSHTWSLAEEEQFYVVWPVVLLILLRLLTLRRLLLLLVALILVIWVWRYVLIADGASYNRVYFGGDTHADPLLAGCALALARRCGVLKGIPPWLYRAAAGMGGCFLMVFSFLRLSSLEPAWAAFYMTCTTIAAASVVLYVVTNQYGWLTRRLESRWVVYVGKRSYGIYLWHYLIFGYLIFHVPAGLLTFLADLGLTLVIASLSYKYVELPALRLKRRWRRTAMHEHLALGA